MPATGISTPSPCARKGASTDSLAIVRVVASTATTPDTVLRDAGLIAGSMAITGTGDHDLSRSTATTLAVLHATTIAFAPDSIKNAGDRIGPVDDERFRSITIRRVCRIGDVQQILVRQLTPDSVQDRQPRRRRSRTRRSASRAGITAQPMKRRALRYMRIHGLRSLRSPGSSS